MALTKTVTTKYDLVIPNAYCRVENVLLKTKNTIEFLLRSYVTTTSVAEFSCELFCCDYDLLESNPIEQAYKYLKTLPEFADATDC